MDNQDDKIAAYGRLAPAWNQVYPADEFGKVAKFIQDQWVKVVSHRPVHFHLGSHESKLTKFFNSILEQFKSEAGFIGHFTSEAVHGVPDLDQGLLMDERRTDIRYLSARSDLTVTFEFKKLKDNRDSRLKYYGKSGVLRFVEGHYSKENSIGVMVGLVGNNSPATVTSLQRAFAMTGTHSLLHMIPCPQGRYVRDPSDALPSIATFDTEHSRAVYDGRPEILLCHMFLNTPDAKPKP